MKRCDFLKRAGAAAVSLLLAGLAGCGGSSDGGNQSDGQVFDTRPGPVGQAIVRIEWPKETSPSRFLHQRANRLRILVRSQGRHIVTGVAVRPQEYIEFQALPLNGPVEFEAQAYEEGKSDTVLSRAVEVRQLAPARVTEVDFTLASAAVRVDVTSLSSSLITGERQRLAARSVSENGATVVAGEGDFEWTSDHPEIVSVDPLGNALAVSAGAAVITARERGNDNTGRSGSVTISVANGVVGEAATIVDLGALDEGDRYIYTHIGLRRFSINNRTQIVGSVVRATDNEPHAFLWEPGGKMTDLGMLPGSVLSHANDINDNGEVVGYSYNSADDYYHAFLWRPGHGMVDLGVTGSFRDSLAFSINNSGQVAGYQVASRTFNKNAFIWTQGSGMKGLDRAAGETSAYIDYLAYAINSSGQIVGFRENPYGGGNTKGFLWKAAGSAATLFGNDEICPYAVNDNGQVTGTIGEGDSAFVWQEGSGFSSLGHLHRSGWPSNRTQGYGINNKGQVVGDSNALAFLWESGKGMTDLNTLLPADSGWQLRAAYDINDSGQIVGLGEHYGKTRVFLLTLK